MIKRKIDSYLEQYFSSSKTALLITGARQIGKSYSVRQFGQTHYESYIELNFISNPEYARLFETPLGADEILLRISAVADKPLIKGKTLIFFDEVQRVPEIITAIKFLVAEGSYHYILSGSLLGLELNNIRSVTVGYMTITEMYPLDIEEFFSACGVSDEVLSNLQKCYENKMPVDAFVHDKMMELFRLYLIVGGMPAVVQTYLDTNNIRDVVSVQQQIIRMYKEDISQYDKQNKLYIEDIFDLIPAELNAQNKRFILKNLNENFKFNRYEDSFIWLREAVVALPTYNVEEPKLPLELSKLRNLFKLFSNDVGLLAAQYADGIQLRILQNDADINCGSVYENAVAQELSAHGFRLYYFNSKKQGEVDFVIKLGETVVPIEVKSGKYYQRHNALKNILSNDEYHIRQGYVLCNDNLRIADKVTYLPIYMIMFLHEQELPQMIYKVDLNGVH